MARVKRTINLPVKDTGHMLEIMKKLSTLDADLEAEARPKMIRIFACGTKEELRDLELKVKEFIVK